jgi:hypothetical protein
LILSIVAGGVMLNAAPPRAPSVAKGVSSSTALAIVASNPYGDLYRLPYGDLYDPGFSKRATTDEVPQSSAQSESALFPPSANPVVASLESIPAPPRRDLSDPAETAPLPPVRPAELDSPAASAPISPRRSAQSTGKTVAPPAPSDNRNFIEKLFGALQHPSGPALGYAAPETSIVGKNTAASAISASTTAAAPAPAASTTFSPSSSGRGPSFASLFGFSRSSVSPTSMGYDRFTAVYDLSAHVVYLPDGTKLEAHSGLGDRLDDPNHVSERMRGATPPHLYELEPREASFHGVQALRLNPVGGESEIFGRAGLLAHSYMLGPNGDSNGCVSFKDYDAFLRAYQNGQIRKLAVVVRL